ncbi:MAG: asparagine synthase (glutamine-hydrolyzing), partial [Actinobacteria bacterium]|nr:asparagine synthase (glutamine-hydrolyzing) [Actinomycetota bacterium]
MCGIVGILDPRRRRAQDESEGVLRCMAEAMTSRGPDGGGEWTDAACGIGFGHRRLAVLDLSAAGHQPMASADDRFVISYNGEIYNHRELAAELEARGVRFRGHSDTEILIEAFGQWGVGPTLDRVDGMFAFGVWDRRERQLVLARDRLGEKPLFYGRLKSGDVVFGSTVDALRRHPEFDFDLDLDALALFFRHKYVPAPWSVYAGIAKLPAGHTVTVAEDGTIADPEAYWSYFEILERGATFTGTDREAVDHLDALLRRSVRRRMIADVPVGAFLSGGVDSSTVVALGQQESNVAVRTFTIGSTHADYDESDAAREVAKHLGTDHTEQVVTGADALAVVDRLGPMYDEPFADSSQIPTFLVSQLARGEVTVALSGDGGDELFGGYNRYLSLPGLWKRFERIPRPLRQRASHLLEAVPPKLWDRAARVVPQARRPQQVGLKVNKALQVAAASSPYDAYLRLVTHWPAPERLVPGSHEPPTLHRDAVSGPRLPGMVEHMMAVDGVTYLPDDILTKLDRATMAVSLESRIPLLDREIVEFAAGLPLSMKIRPDSSKWVLRQVLDRYVPLPLVDRPKAGFGLPIDDWLRGPLREWAEGLIGSAAVCDHLD